LKIVALALFLPFNILIFVLLHTFALGISEKIVFHFENKTLINSLINKSKLLILWQKV